MLQAMVPTAEKVNPRGEITIIMQATQRMQHALEKKDTTPAERWELKQLAPTCLCRIHTMQDLPKIWADLASLKKENTRT